MGQNSPKMLIVTVVQMNTSMIKKVIFYKKIMLAESPMINLLKRYFIALWLMTAIGTMLACEFGSWIPSPVMEDCQKTIEPSEQDVKYALGFTGNTFKSDEWQRSYFVEGSRVGVTWLNNQESGLAYLEYLIYSCGYTQADVDDYFSEQNFKEVIFRDYQNLQRKARCTSEKGDLTLYEFTAKWEGADYLLRYWVKLDSRTRILTLLLAYPHKSEALLDGYGEEVFPALTVCQE